MEYELVKVRVKDIVKKKTKKAGKLHDITVEDDNSYVAGGIVVHNSRPNPFIRTTLNTKLPTIVKEELARDY